MTLTTLKIPKFYLKATQQEKDLQQEEADFTKTLMADYSTQFANQSAILDSLKSTFEPILQAGPDQFGFSPTETTALRTSASDTTATSFANAKQSLNETLASRGGGDTYLPSGATAQLNAGLDVSAAIENATQQNQITQAGYTQGRSNFVTAASVLGGAAQQYNPLGYSTSSTDANKSAFDEASTIQQQDSAWVGQLGGLIGGAAGAFLGNPSTKL